MDVIGLAAVREREATMVDGQRIEDDQIEEKSDGLLRTWKDIHTTVEEREDMLRVEPYKDEIIISQGTSGNARYAVSFPVSKADHICAIIQRLAKQAAG